MIHAELARGPARPNRARSPRRLRLAAIALAEAQLGTIGAWLAGDLRASVAEVAGMIGSLRIS
jgi:hypothetical protein|nr:hypothetical protein [Kofleriaceae bacterium]